VVEGRLPTGNRWPWHEWHRRMEEHIRMEEAWHSAWGVCRVTGTMRRRVLTVGANAVYATLHRSNALCGGGMRVRDMMTYAATREVISARVVSIMKVVDPPFR